MTNSSPASLLPLVDLKREYAALRAEILPVLERALERADFIVGEDVGAFEKEFAAFCEAKDCVGVANGGDALYLALRALDVGPGDEVVVPAMTFVATVDAVARVGAKPVLVDSTPGTVLLDPKQAEAAVTSRTKAILPVHLHGEPAHLAPLLDLCADRGIALVEDAAQAQGARYKGRRVGSFGQLAGFSFYPGKNLGAYGDAGGITTSDPTLAKRLRVLREYGSPKKYEHVEVGVNSRLDTVQAAILRVKLRHLDAGNEARRRHAAAYTRGLAGLRHVRAPPAPRGDHIWHIYAVRTTDRDGLARHLREQGIASGIHYPTPIHLQPVYAALGHRAGAFPEAEAAAREMLSLPMFPLLREDEIAKVCEAVRSWPGA